MSKNQGQQPEISTNAVSTADGTNSSEQSPTGAAPASETQHQTATESTEAPQKQFGAVAVEEYERELAQALAQAEVDDQPQGTPAEGSETPEGEETADQPTGEDAPDGDESTVDDDQPAATEDTPPKQKEFRPRLGNIKDQRQQEAILLANQLAADGQTISLGEAERRVALKYGEDPAKPAGEEPAAETPRTVEEVDTELESLEDEFDQALIDLDGEKQVAIRKQMKVLRAERTEVATHQQTAEQTAETEFNSQVDASHAEAATIYPSITEPNHAIHKEAEKIWSAMEKTGNPLIGQADAPLRVYQMAANALGIAPNDSGTHSQTSGAARAPSSTTAAPKLQSVKAQAVRRPTPAVSLPSGGSSTSQAGPLASPVEKIHSANDYDKFIEGVA